MEINGIVPKEKVINNNQYKFDGSYGKNKRKSKKSYKYIWIRDPNDYVVERKKVWVTIPNKDDFIRYAIDHCNDVMTYNTSNRYQMEKSFYYQMQMLI